MEMFYQIWNCAFFCLSPRCSNSSLLFSLRSTDHFSNMNYTLKKNISNGTAGNNTLLKPIWMANINGFLLMIVFIYTILIMMLAILSICSTICTKSKKSDRSNPGTIQNETLQKEPVQQQKRHEFRVRN